MRLLQQYLLLTKINVGMENKKGICITHSCIPLFTVYIIINITINGGMQEYNETQQKVRVQRRLHTKHGEEARREYCICGSQVLNPLVGEVLQCEKDPYNVHGRWILQESKKGGTVVGNKTLILSLLFLQRVLQ